MENNSQVPYLDWLTGLKVGDKVKTTDCRHHRGCHCENTVVTAITEVFGEPAVTVVSGCKVSYYSKKNGRELGARKNTYKNGSILPFTEADQERIDYIKDQEEIEKEHQEQAKRLSFALCDSDALTNYLKRHIPLGKIEVLLHDLQNFINEEA